MKSSLLGTAMCASAWLSGFAMMVMLPGEAVAASGSRYADPNPALSACRALQHAAADVPAARENGVAREKATQDVLEALGAFGRSEDAELAWSAFVEETYQSTWTRAHIADRYQQLCAPYETLQVPLPFP